MCPDDLEGFGPGGTNTGRDVVKSPYRDVQVMQCIVTNILRRGSGTDGSPIRIIRQVWTLDGELIAERDPLKVEQLPTHRATAR